MAFYTQGCRSNQSETAVLQNIFEGQGYAIRSFNEPADILVVNTCTVTENSESDLRKLVNRVVRQQPHIQVALIGCQAQLHTKELARFPNVRWIVGTADKMRLPEILSSASAAEYLQVIRGNFSRGPFSVPAAGIDRQHSRANIKIQDGCDEFCSFCEVPYARGRARSRVFSDIRKEAKTLVNAGHQELVITGKTSRCVLACGSGDAGRGICRRHHSQADRGSRQGNVRRQDRSAGIHCGCP